MLLLNDHAPGTSVNDLVFSPDGKELYSAGEDGSLQGWDLDSRAHGVILQEDLPCRTVDISKGLLAWSTTEGAWFRPLRTKGKTRTIVSAEEALTHVRFHPAGSKVFQLSVDWLSCWQTKPLRCLWEDATDGDPEEDGSPTAFAVSPDGSYLAAAIVPSTPMLPATPFRDKVYRFPGVRIHETEYGEVVSEIAAQIEITGLSFSPDGQRLAMTHGDCCTVREFLTERIVWEKRFPRRLAQRCAFSPDGRFLALALSDRTVRLLEVGTWHEEAVHDWRVGRVCSLAFTADGMKAAVGGDSGKIVVWDVDL